GANSEIIWTAFAKRGVGFSADQGSSNVVGDETEAFDLPPAMTASEGATQPQNWTHRLSSAYPNPFRSAARLVLEVAEPQAVRAVVYDVTGREVARLYDGDLPAGTRHELALSGRDLAAGVYLVRVTGETFQATERVTVLR
ncbi:MAG: T9SS type A sorting domain-containing protein, partial [Rhodothermales bacterium]|nr:T9SS type A sorting domain-containing protein [Rhodothermales bacterium]